MAISNLVTLIGNLGKDAEMRYTNSGKPVISFRIAVRRYGGKDAPTDWFSASMFGERGEKLVNYLVTGVRIGLVGRLETYEYERDGKTVSGVQINVSDIEFMQGSKRDDSGETRSPAAAAAADDDEAYPF